MKIIERSGAYQVHFTDAAGERQRLSTRVKVDPTQPDRGRNQATLAALELMREKLLDATPAGERGKAGKSRTLGQALTRCYENLWRHQKSSREKRYQVQVLIKEIGYWPLAGVTYDRLMDYAKELEGAGDAASTRNRKMSTIHTAMTEEHKVDRDLVIPAFPHWPENNVKERYVSDTEEADLLAHFAGRAAPDDAEACYMRDLLPFLLDTGARISEALTLTTMQDRGAIVWFPHGSTKNGKGRTVPLTERARASLTAMLASPLVADLHAWHRQNKNKPASWAGTRFRAACDKLKIEGVTLHTLRHTCASRLVQAGVDLYVVKEWLGHSSITITERYAHLNEATLTGALAALQNRRVATSETVSQRQPVLSSNGT